jgi:hypothetical protein
MLGSGQEFKSPLGHQLMHTRPACHYAGGRLHDEPRRRGATVFDQQHSTADGRGELRLDECGRATSHFLLGGRSGRLVDVARPP